MIGIASPSFDHGEIEKVTDVLKSGFVAQGKVTEEFEKKFAGYCGTKYAIAVCNGTAALHTAMFALGVSEGNEVITTPFTFVATANSILMQRAKPVFVDIDPETYNLDISQVEEQISEDTKVVLPVDLYGQPCDYGELKSLADKHQLSVLEDACQAIGAEYEDYKAGALGDIGVFSLYATKNITTGEGGMITTDNDQLADKCRKFRHHGQVERYEYVGLGYNYRITDIASGIGLVQLSKVDDFNAIRKKNAKLYNSRLENIEGVKVPVVASNRTHVYHQYTIKITEGYGHTRDELVKYLKDNEVGAGVYYPKPLHLFDHLQKYGYKKGDFPVAEAVSSRVLSLPVHQRVGEEMVEKISNLIIDFKNK